MKEYVRDSQLFHVIYKHLKEMQGRKNAPDVEIFGAGNYDASTLAEGHKVVGLNHVGEIAVRHRPKPAGRIRTLFGKDEKMLDEKVFFSYLAKELSANPTIGAPFSEVYDSETGVFTIRYKSLSVPKRYDSVMSEDGTARNVIAHDLVIVRNFPVYSTRGWLAEHGLAEIVKKIDV